MSTNDQGGKTEQEKDGANQKNGVDLTNLTFTSDGAVQGLSDEDLDSVAGGLADMDSDCGCGEMVNVGCK